METDYLIVGAGATGLAAADVLLAETDAHLTIVDRDHAPGGHWNRSYPFVRLHQPGQHYGLMSQPLDVQLAETFGPNKGMATLTRGAELAAYFQRVMEEVLLPSGRVRYLPMHEVTPEGRVRSLLTGVETDVTVNRKVVEAYHGAGTIPATHVPGFEVDADAPFVPVNALGDLRAPVALFVILGSGKTGIDACLWLLRNGVPPERIVWVSPRDAWMLDRRMAQPSAAFLELKLRRVLSENRALIEAASVEDLFDRLEAGGNLMRLDPAVRPTAYKCATVTEGELDELRRIGSMLRMGHVRRVSRTAVEMDKGRFDLPAGALCVDCTASAIPAPIPTPVFQPGRIVLNAVRTCQPTFSAAVIAHLEARGASDDASNALARPVPLPRDDVDWLWMNFVNRQNQYAWMQDPAMRAWLKSCRLDALGNVERPATRSPEAEVMGAGIKETMFPSTLRLKQLLDGLPAPA